MLKTVNLYNFIRPLQLLVIILFCSSSQAKAFDQPLMLKEIDAFHQGTLALQIEDYAVAAKWFEKAANEGDGKAQYNLGWIYNKGHLGKKDYVLAAKWYEKAANQGYKSAQFNLGWIYEHGHLGEKDFFLAAKWYEKAANQGHSGAQNNLAGIYNNGHLGKKDYVLAAKWYKKAANQGSYMAQLNLGMLYNNNSFEEKNNTLAAKWLVNAANQADNKVAEQWVKKIKSSNTIEHKILGSNGVLSDFYEVLSDVKVSHLQVRLVRKYFDLNCTQGYIDHIELHGEINNDSTYVVDKLLKDISPCVGFDGTVYVTSIYVNSGGGLLEDGYKLGRIFKNHGVSAKISHSQTCASSCANAFLGATFRSMSGDGILLFHAPYVVGDYGNIYCRSASNEKSLKNYYIEMLGDQQGKILFNRTMNYCSSSTGWTVNKDAANIYELLN